MFNALFGTFVFIYSYIASLKFTSFYPMKIKKIDHIVIPVSDIERAIRFYTGVLNMRLDTSRNRYAVAFGSYKINLHVGAAEFLPAAKNPTYGSADICLLVDGDIKQVKEELESKGIVIEEGIVRRNGSCGPIDSIYIRDPDGNLVELSTPA